MAEGVAEVEQRAATRLALVLGDDARLQLAAAPDRMDQRAPLAREDLFHIGLEPVDERGIEGKAMLDHLGQAGAQLTVGQRVQGSDVRDHGARLVKGADHVLAQGVIDGGLAADRRIHLSKQRGGYLDEWHATLVDRGGKAREVANHAAAQGNDQRVAAAASLQQIIEQAVEGLPALGLFAIGDDDLGNARAVHCTPHSLEIDGRNPLVGHDRRGAARQVRAIELGCIENAGADVDRVGAAAEGYAERFHAVPSCSSRPRASTWTLWRAVSTTRSAISRYRGSRSR